MYQNLLSSFSREAPILLAGPTASGKSALAMELSARDGRVIVNADALQVYRCWRLLSARPSPEEEARLPHALYGHIGREQAYSVGHWLRELAALLARPLVIVGGTGLYFSSLTNGLAEIPQVPHEVRARGDAIERTQGFQAMIAALDEPTRAKIDLANGARVRRAWEVLQATGEGLAAWQSRTPTPLLPLRGARPVEACVLWPDTDWLNLRIERRFDAMMAAGVLEELRAEQPFWQPERPSARAIGARELMAYLEGHCTRAEAIEAAKTASRHYAKRQRTWFRSRMKEWRRIDLPL